MRNLKKILALVLALVMSMSLMITANAFKDDEKISGDYAEAVEVLDGLGVFQGYEDGSFQPQGKITRAEVAAIIYRIVTGDVKDNQVAIYSDYNKFTDTNEAKWAAGYIGFCANAEYIKGYGDGKFGPNDQVTGYQALAMILRAVGYDVNGEFTGTGWQVQVASTAKKLGILENVVEGTLGTPATREVVAEILFQTITKAPQVEYTLAFGYQPVNYKGLTKTLGEATFQLVKGDRTEIDKWGRPGYYWFAYSNKTVVATIEESYKAQYETAVTECQVAQDAKFTGTKTYTMYVNGVKSTDVLQATDTVDTIGAQGRQTEVYSDRIVMIDTLLALVTDVKDATYDAAGHLKTPSKITLAVYDADTATYAAGHTYVMTNGATNYSYAAGNMVLLNAYTVSGNRDTAGVVSTDRTTNVGVYGEIYGLADAVDGTQTVVWFNTSKHTVNGTTYDDAAEFHLDEAGSKTNNYTWYFDQFGNIIGNVEVATQYTYAVMTSIWWTNDASNGAGVAKATLKYMDGTDNVVTLAKVEGCTPVYASDGYFDIMERDSYNRLHVATNAAINARYDNAGGADDLIHGHLFQVQTLSDGSVILNKVGTTTANGSYHNQLTNNVSIINRYGYITSNEGNVAIDTETKFLVRGTSEASDYVTYTGLNELPTFKAGAVVDYVLGAGGVADYVYIIGETVDSNANNFVLVTGNAYSAVLKTIGGVSYWELTLPVPAEDGSVATLKILDSDANMTTVPANVTTLTNTANHGKLFYVATTNGYVAESTGVTEITNNVFSYGTTGRAVMLTDAKMLTGVAGGVINGTVNGTVANVRFNVTSSTVVVGTLAADMTDKVVYVIYSSTNNDAAKVYVLDINSTIGTTGTINALTVTVTSGVSNGTYVSAVGFVANATASTPTVGSAAFAGTVSATPVWQKLNTVTGVYENYAGDAFVAGTYRAIVTLTVNNAANQSYSIASNAPISYYGQAGKTGSTFITDPIVVNP